jgi:hypothetical protein
VAFAAASAFCCRQRLLQLLDLGRGCAQFRLLLALYFRNQL